MMVIEGSKYPSNPLKKLTKLIMSILVITILVTCVVIGLLIKYTSPQAKGETVFENFTMDAESRNNSDEEMDTTLEIVTTEGVGIDLRLFDTTSFVENVTSNHAPTQTIKGKLTKLLLLLSFINFQFNARQLEESLVFSL